MQTRAIEEREGRSCLFRSFFLCPCVVRLPSRELRNPVRSLGFLLFISKEHLRCNQNTLKKESYNDRRAFVLILDIQE